MRQIIPKPGKYGVDDKKNCPLDALKEKTKTKKQNEKKKEKKKKQKRKRRRKMRLNLVKLNINFFLQDELNSYIFHPHLTGNIFLYIH